MSAIIGLYTLQMHIPESQSLKDKRAILKSAIKRLHNTYNVSVAEIDHHDQWQSAAIAITVVSNRRRHTERVLQQCLDFIEKHYPQLLITQQTLEIL